MSRLVDNFRNIFKIEELRQRITYDRNLLLSASSTHHPGIDVAALERQSGQGDSGLFGLYDLCQCIQERGVFALASCPISPLRSLSVARQRRPVLPEIIEEGEDGRRRSRSLRVGTFFISAAGNGCWLRNLSEVPVRTCRSLPRLPRSFLRRQCSVLPQERCS